MNKNTETTSRNQWLDLDKGTFLAKFPREPFIIRHRLVDHPLFTVPRLLELSKALPENCVEYNAGNIDINMGYKDSPRTGLSVEETIRRIRDAKSWMVLKYVEKDPEYKALLDECLDQVAEWSGQFVEGTYNREGFIFLTSPGSTTPFHVDPEHNFLLQIQGNKFVSQFDPEDTQVVTDADIERGLFGKQRNLTYNDEIQKRGKVFELLPGMGLHFPVAAPHWVKNGTDVSVSFSITFRSRTSERNLAIREFNFGMRGHGMNPTPLGQSALGDTAKYQLSRVLRRVGFFKTGSK